MRFQFVCLGVCVIAAYVALVLWLWWRGRKPLAFVGALASLAVASYGVNWYFYVLEPGGCCYKGFLSDNPYMLALINNAAHGNYSSDMYDKALPTHYPPLWFWIVGTVGRFAGLGACEAHSLAPFLTLALLPFGLYALGKKLGGADSGLLACVVYFGFGGAVTTYLAPGPRLFASMDWAVYKPYEIVGSLFALWWLLEVPSLWTHEDALFTRKVARVGAIGALAWLLYYPWFLMALASSILATAIAQWPVNQRASRRIVVRLALAASLSACLASPYWYPYASRALRDGVDPNYGWSFFAITFLDPTRPTIGLGYCGLVFWLGMVGLLRYCRKRRDALPVLLTIGLSYAWYFSVYVTYPLTGSAFLSGLSIIFIFPLLAVLGGFGLASLLRGRSYSGHALVALLLAMAVLVPTPLQWNARTDWGWNAAREGVRGDVRELAGLIQDRKTGSVYAGIGAIPSELAAISQASAWVSPNSSFGNPLFGYEKRRVALLAGLQRIAGGDSSVTLPVSILFLTKSDRGTLTFSLPRLQGGGDSQNQALMEDPIELSKEALAAGGFELIGEGDDSAIAVRTR